MTSFEIQGGLKLQGEINPQGAKNEALQVIAATILSKEKIIIENIPEIIDVLVLIDILKNIGVKVEKISKGTYSFQADNINFDYFENKEFRKKSSSIRGSIMIAGAMLARFKKAYISMPGGDKIGRRRIDTHFYGFSKLGAKINYDEDHNIYNLEAKKLVGTYILLPEASVTGTANIIMAAVLSQGETTIYNAASEPYVQQLCKMLVKMGAKISGISSNLLQIQGVKELKGCSHKILPDMIEIGSIIGLAAMTQSNITIKNVDFESLGAIPNNFENLGVKIIKDNKNIIIPEQKQYKIKNFVDGSIMNISDAPWPGLSPDMISILLVTAIQAKGSVLMHQKMFESRLFFVDKLIDMGAKIILCDPHRATVIGINREYKLKATTMVSPDIRAGVALLIAALSAKGTSIIHNIEQIDRGYENIDQRLNAMGAKIKRV